MKIHLLIFLCVLNFLKVGALTPCFECSLDAHKGIREGGSCIKPDVSTHSALSCFVCYTSNERTNNSFKIERSCGQTQLSIDETCDPEKKSVCGCTGDVNLPFKQCNDHEFDKPSFIIDCYNCTGFFDTEYKSDADKSCFKTDEKTPIQQDCVRCRIDVGLSELGTSITRRCDNETNPQQWRNISSSKMYSCHDSSLCNKFEIRPVPILIEENTERSIAVCSLAAYFLLCSILLFYL